MSSNNGAPSPSETPRTLRVQDISGQQAVELAEIDPQATVGELVEGLLAELHLPTTDADGRPLAYQARDDQQGRHLNASERVGDVIDLNSSITLVPNINAG